MVSFSAQRVSVKICGVTDKESMEASIVGGADFAGLVFFEKSPRALTLPEAADLAHMGSGKIHRVGLFVDPDDDLLQSVTSRVDLDQIQLHGSESPQRCRQILDQFSRPIIKALPVRETADLESAYVYLPWVSFLLFDAKPPRDADRPGGLGLSFDWNLLKGQFDPTRYMVAGGLNPDNVRLALAQSGARAVDCSSGVEVAPGQKDPKLIHEFLGRIPTSEVG